MLDSADIQNACYDPVTAFYLRTGTVRSRSANAIRSVLDLWADCSFTRTSRPRGIPPRPANDPLSIRDIIPWAQSVNLHGRGAAFLVIRGYGLKFNHSDNSRCIEFLIRPDDQGRVRELSFEWAHDGMVLTRMLKQIGRHWADMIAWTDPTPIEMETILVEPLSTQAAPFPHDFGVGEEGQWNLFGVEWPFNRGGIVRMEGGRWLLATIPLVVSDEALTRTRRALPHGWRIERLSVLTKP